MLLKETGFLVPLNLRILNEERGKVGSKKTQVATAGTVLGPNEKSIGALTMELMRARTIVIDRGGSAVRIELNRGCEVHRRAYTVMIHLPDKPTPAGTIALGYRIVPFIAP